MLTCAFALNPKGKVPTLLIDAEALTEAVSACSTRGHVRP